MGRENQARLPGRGWASLPWEFAKPLLSNSPRFRRVFAPCKHTIVFDFKELKDWSSAAFGDDIQNLCDAAITVNR